MATEMKRSGGPFCIPKRITDLFADIGSVQAYAETGSNVGVRRITVTIVPCDTEKSRAAGLYDAPVAPPAS